MAMGPTKQLLILQRLTFQLQQITPANGYDYDLSASVYRGRLAFGADASVPFVSINEALRPDPRPMEGGEAKLKRHEFWPLILQGWVNPVGNIGMAPTDDLYQLMGACMACLARVVAESAPGVASFPEYRLGGVITSMGIGPGVVRAATPQAGGTECFYLPVTVGYATNVADPYSLSVN
jgi:hypothetical protein